MFDEIDRVYKEQKCDAIIFGGDIFDKYPTLEELDIFISYLWKNASRSSIIYDGNHEATKRGDTFLKYLKSLVPENTVVVIDHYTYQGLRILPYCKLHQYEKETGANKPILTSKVLLTHVRGEVPPHVKPEVDLDIFNGCDIVFAGDLHAHSNSQRNIIYPGSPTTVTFHRNNVETGVIVFDTLSPKMWKWHGITVPQLIRKTITNPKDMVKTPYDHTIYELKGNILELSKIKDIEILDKKIVEHKNEATLDLKGLDINEEITLYCSKILQLPDKKITKLLKVYNDNTQEVEMG